MVLLYLKKILVLVAIMLSTIASVLAQSDSLIRQSAFNKLDSIIQVNYIQGDDKLADSLLARVIKDARVEYGPTHAFYGYFLQLKANSLADRGRHQEAIDYYEKARGIFLSSPALYIRLQNLISLAQAYVLIGPLAKAQDAVREAEEMMSIPPRSSKDLEQALIWDLKAKIFMKLFDFKQAIAFQRLVLDRYKESKGAEFDRYYPDAAANLASILFLTERDKEAQNLLDSVKVYFQSSPNPNHAALWKVYLFEGQISQRQKEYDRAEDSFLQALLLLKRQSSPNNLWISMVYSYLGSYYQSIKKDTDRAEYYFSLSRSGLEKLGITNDFLTARALNDLASLHMQKGLYQQASTELAESQRLIRAEQQSNFGFTATRQKDIEAKANQAPFLNALSFTAYMKQRGEKSDTLFRQLSYDAALYMNGLLLDDARQIRQTLVGSKDPVTRQLHKKWADLKQDAADSLANFPTRNAQLKQEIDSLEQQMALKSTAYGTGKAMSLVDWRQISKKLRPEEASIAFVRFPALNTAPASPDSILYAALIVRPKQIAPDMVVLCSEQQVQAALTNRRQRKSGFTNRGTELGTRKQLNQASVLHRLIWQPMEPFLRGTKRIFYSPSGLLHTISFAGLRLSTQKKSSQRYLIDRYELRQLFSTREVGVGIQPLHGSTKLSALLIGGVNYGRAAGNQFDSLPGSAREVDKIHKLLPRAILLKDKAAREDQVKAISGHSPMVIHLATHGFYLPDYVSTAPTSSTAGDQPKKLVAADPLQRSGLALEGANRIHLSNEWAGVANDGILTANEVSILDLSQTRLVVLSACETALGDVQGAEGVYGLQRAFRLAGAEKLLVSLRPVPDLATQQLMTYFYTYLQKGIEVHSALRQAQYRLRKLNPDPTVWAAFVLIE